jgi:hypothetical protein
MLNTGKCFYTSCGCLALVVTIGSTAFAQQSTAPAEAEQQAPTPAIAVDATQKAPRLNFVPTTEDNPGKVVGDYEVKESAEIGVRITSYTGNVGTWDSYVNLGTGPRLLEYSLNLHSPDHKGFLFDDLTFNNFGYGGDPNNVSRLLLQKGRLYTFNGSFRRDVNIFDYNLLANPLNPPTSVPNIPILNSPHEFIMTRRMTDTNLVLFPAARVQFHAAYSRVSNQGTTFSSFHQGTEALLTQPTSYINDIYSGGVSFRLIPRTSINYDQFYTFFKGDTTAQLTSPGSAIGFGIPTFTLPTAATVSFGLPYNSGPNGAGQPCVTPVLADGTANPSCNGFTSYTRFGRVRNTYPTEQFSLQSDYWSRVDIAARVVYSDAESLMPNFASMFAGLETRTATAIQNIVAPPGGGAQSHRLSLTTEFGVTVRLTDKFNLIDQFRYNNFRIPGNWLYTTNSLFAATLTTAPNLYSPANCPTITSLGCPQHTTSSGADVITDSLTDFLRQATTMNTIELQYQPNRRYSGYIGYRFDRRNIADINSDNQVSVFYPTLPNRGACAGQPLVNGVCTAVTLDSSSDIVQINGQSGLLGVAARPTDKWRLNGDVEIYTGDNTFTRIYPRHLQIYKVKAIYKPNESLNLSAATYIRNNSNTSFDIGNIQHNRSYSVVGTYSPPASKWGIDLSYDYNDIFSQTNICFVSTPTPPGALSCGTPFLQGLSVYTELTHFAAGSVMWKPVKRVTANVGYTITSSTGSTLILNPNAPTGPLSYNYTLPSAGLAVELWKNYVLKGNWNYYDYNEKSEPGPTLPRDFRGNVFTFSIRYLM